MNDRKLLEYAAKAAGYYLEWVNGVSSPLSTTNTGFMEWWDPLTDDGDALRLAVKLSIDIEHQCPGVEAYRSHNHENYDGGETFCAGEDGTDQYAATRRAIVRAAAEIGKQMNGT